MSSQTFDRNLETIASARYGRDMRSAIHDCIEELGELIDASSGVDIATTSKTGIVKPDGTTILIDQDGTIHASADLSQILSRIVSLENRVTALESVIHDPAEIMFIGQNGETEYIDYEPTNVDFITSGGEQ